MKISCILTSFNRPTLLLQALESVARQTHGDYELLVVDDSAFEILDVTKVVEQFPFKFPRVRVWHFDVTPQERAQRNRLGVNINFALRQAEGDLVCYLADDDYYFKDWFVQANDFFLSHPQAVAGFGSLFYSSSPVMDFSMGGICRFPEQPISKPAGKLDHNQVMHRRFDPPILWPEDVGSVKHSDGIFFTDIALKGQFRPIYGAAAVKRLHTKNLQDHIGDLEQGKLESRRD